MQYEEQRRLVHIIIQYRAILQQLLLSDRHDTWTPSHVVQTILTLVFDAHGSQEWEISKYSIWTCFRKRFTNFVNTLLHNQRNIPFNFQIEIIYHCLLLFLFHQLSFTSICYLSCLSFHYFCLQVKVVFHLNFTPASDLPANFNLSVVSTLPI